MPRTLHATTPTVLLRISDGSFHMHRAFSDFRQAVRSAESYSSAGFSVAMISATGRYLMTFDPRPERAPA